MTDVSGYISRINALSERGDHEAALKIAEEGLKKFPENGSLLIGKGNALHGLGRAEEAVSFFKKGAELLPEDPVSLSNLAGVLYELKRFDEALEACDEAIGRDASYVNARIHRGNVYSETERYADALASYEEAERLSPDNDLILFNKASALTMLGRLAEAAACYERLLEKTPDSTEYLSALAALREREADFDGAAELYLRILNASSSAAVRICLAGCLYAMRVAGNEERALEFLDVWLERVPDDPIARHTLDTFGKEEIGRASAAYVTELFDTFADSFDEVLEGLEYRAPLLIAEAVRKAVLPEGCFESVLDLGCGTGLCGKYLNEKGICARLTGIDLSEAMLEKARERGIYNVLERADIPEYLSGCESEFDLIVSSDVFTYLGDLNGVFSGIFKALKRDGCAIFTVTENVSAPDSYVLGPSGRFAHGEKYVSRKLDENGLFSKAVTRVELRKEMGESVPGLLVICRKTDAAPPV